MTADFLAVLDRWGPESSHATPTPVEARDYCRRLARSHYENFPVVSILLPFSLRQHFFNVYAYCRWADDLADEVGNADCSLALLKWWRGELDRCYQGETHHPVFVALTETIHEFAIPQEPFTDLLSAFEQDQRVVEYETFDQLRDYCRRSADPVGRLLLYLGESHNEQNLAWSDSICTGLQLANFWQDVRRDYEKRRVYLPREDRERFGYSLTQMQSKSSTPQFIELMKFEVARARQYLNDGLPLVKQLPGRLQIDIELFARGGLRTLDRIEEIGYQVWELRPVVTKFDFARLLIRSVGAAVVRKVLPSRTAATRRSAATPAASANTPVRSTGERP